MSAVFRHLETPGSEHCLLFVSVTYSLKVNGERADGDCTAT